MPASGWKLTSHACVSGPLFHSSALLGMSSTPPHIKSSPKKKQSTRLCKKKTESLFQALTSPHPSVSAIAPSTMLPYFKSQRLAEELGLGIIDAVEEEVITIQTHMDLFEKRGTCM